MPVTVRADYIALGDLPLQYLEGYTDVSRHSRYIPPLVNTRPMVKVHHPMGELTKSLYVGLVGIATVHTRYGLNVYDVGYDAAPLAPLINGAAAVPVFAPRSFRRTLSSFVSAQSKTLLRRKAAIYTKSRRFLKEIWLLGQDLNLRLAD